jgi:DNA mismatch endonuclease (patch repair protein)
LTDVVDRQTRSRMMAGIRGRDTRPELVVRSYLHAAGLRFRLHDRRLPGRPDIVLPRYRVVVLVHGCFWHRHPGCRYATTPASRRDFWMAKLTANVDRDRRDAESLKALGWSVFTIWECQTRDAEQLDQLFWRIVGSGEGGLDGFDRKVQGFAP